MLKKLVVASFAAQCSAQLIWKPLEELKAEVELQQPAADEQVQDSGFSHPTLCDPSVNQTSGYIKAANGPLSPEYFFWLFESKSDPSNDPLIMWLSGGPGCSSQLALFAENGPCSVSKDGSTTSPNPNSWHNKANVMWVDQPAGTGFSTGLGTHNEDGVASNMLMFLQGFFTQFPQYATSKFYIFGESYAGHYIPAISHKIWESNKAATGVHIPMAGIAIGNGLTDPEEQYKWYAKMGHDGGKDMGGHAPGVFNAAEYAVMEAGTPTCVKSIHSCNNNASVCQASAEGCNYLTQIPYRLTGKNPYDMRIPCEHGNLCYDFDHITTYLNKKEVKAALGAKKGWGSCNMAVNLAFQLAGDWMVNYHTKLPEMLHDGLEVLFYAGDCDYICNWIGNKKWTQVLEWDGKADFNAAADKDWQVAGKTVARLRSAKNFHFMQVFEAGHMVPMDQPGASLEMVNAFVSGKISANIAQESVVV
jgi:cathepsin A (carboxypeptidase C)